VPIDLIVGPEDGISYLTERALAVSTKPSKYPLQLLELIYCLPNLSWS